MAPLGAQGVAARQVAPCLYGLRTAAGSNVPAVAATGGTLLVDAGPADGNAYVGQRAPS